MTGLHESIQKWGGYAAWAPFSIGNRFYSLYAIDLPIATLHAGTAPVIDEQAFESTGWQVSLEGFAGHCRA
jgi:hypothetical protein